MQVNWILRFTVAWLNKRIDLRERQRRGVGITKREEAVVYTESLHRLITTGYQFHATQFPQSHYKTPRLWLRRDAVY